jgi:hypothetical protein
MGVVRKQVADLENNEWNERIELCLLPGLDAMGCLVKILGADFYNPDTRIA